MKKIHIEEPGVQKILGILDENIRLIEKKLGVSIYARGDDFTIEGEDANVALAEKLLIQLIALKDAGLNLNYGDINLSIQLIKNEPEIDIAQYFVDYSIQTSSRKTVIPRSFNQKRYIEAIRNDALVFSIGPAGTGKTYLAMAMAMAALNNHSISRIILTRPAVEAGEKLGFLPGDLMEKVNPYLRPLYDALYDLIEYDKALKLIQRGIIEVAPLAYMRGRTLNDAFIILDEAQNTTPEQMKMFLTRIGFSSKAIVTGDITQIDLPSNNISGLVQAADILKQVEGLSIIYFNEKDVVRHPLVKKIIKAYEQFENSKKKKNNTA
jgi:phosphate starvation-inducible protein PhoH and related proteins